MRENFRRLDFAPKAPKVVEDENQPRVFGIVSDVRGSLEPRIDLNKRDDRNKKQDRWQPASDVRRHDAANRAFGRNVRLMF